MAYQSRNRDQKARQLKRRYTVVFDAKWKGKWALASARTTVDVVNGGVPEAIKKAQPVVLRELLKLKPKAPPQRLRASGVYLIGVFTNG